MIIAELRCGDAINLVPQTPDEVPEPIASVTFIEMNAAGKAVLSFETPLLLLTDFGDITVEGTNASNPFDIEYEENTQQYTTPEIHVSVTSSCVYPRGKRIRLLSDSGDVFFLGDDKPDGSYHCRKEIIRLHGFKQLSDNAIHLKFSHLADDVDFVQCAIG